MKNVTYPTDPESPYYEITTKAIAEFLGEPSKVYDVIVYHDDWCAAFQGYPCNCNPEVKITPVEETNV